jgi:mono/diheme cytochrome c family protein
VRPHSDGSRLLRWSALIAIVVAGAAAATLHAQSARQGKPPLAIESLGATDSYEFYCASCHGDTGRGDGPVASTMRVKPADLTTLAERNGGSFPRERIEGYVTGTGRSIAAHGSRDMPVWGPAFRALDGSDARARVRVAAIVDHLESLQTRENGAAIYRTNCAGCHGSTGRGGASGVSTHKAPPDLTRYSMRNGGVFPSERLTRIIDGRDIASHVDREMPVWGRTFMREANNPGDAKVRARIEALVRYIQSIQERAAE